MEKKIVKYQYEHDHIYKYIVLDFIDSNGNIHPVIPADYQVEIPEEDLKKLIKYLSLEIRNDTKIFSTWDVADIVEFNSEFPDKIRVECSGRVLRPTKKRSLEWIYQNFEPLTHNSGNH